MLRDQEIDEKVDPLTECGDGRVDVGQQVWTRVGAGFDLVTVDGDDEIRPGREVAIDGPDPDAGFGSDLTDRRVDAGCDEDSGRGREEGLLVALCVGPFAPSWRRRWLACGGHCAPLSNKGLTIRNDVPYLCGTMIRFEGSSKRAIPVSLTRCWPNATSGTASRKGI